MTTQLLEQKVENKEELKGGIGNCTPTQLPEEKLLDVQTTLNEMFIKHGGNLPERADYKELLADYGLTQEQVANKHISIARKNLAKFIDEESKKQGPERDNKLEWDTEPTTFQCETSKGVRWITKCRRYRVDMRQALDMERPYYTSSYLTTKGNDMCCEFAPPRENNSEGSELRKYKTLEAALASVEKWHEERFKLSLVFCNRQSVLDTATELGLLPKQQRASKPTTAIATPTTAQGSTLPQGQATGLPAQARQQPQRHMLLGHSLSRVCHFLGSKGWPFERVMRALAHYGITDAKPVSVRTYLTDGKNPNYSKPAQLTQEQIDELDKIV